MIHALLASLALFLAPPPAAGAPQAPALQVRVDRAAGSRPVLHVDGILADSALVDAVRSGLPLRLRLRVELWRDGFFDSLEGSRALTVVVHYAPLEGEFVVRTEASPARVRRFSTFAAARTAVEGAYPLGIAPAREGRYYYTATARLETLSLSDLEELERWLQGELRPAVSGEGSVAGAIGRGAKRVLIRVLGLPARQYEARTDWFRYP